MQEPLARRDVLTVSELNRRARLLLETHLNLVWVRGEVSNFSCPSSGHWYFTLKDAAAQVRCAMFRNRNQLLRTRPRDGDQVLVRGRVGLYEARGDYQLVVEHLEAAGAGLLQQRFEALKEKLRAEGLFDAAHKVPLPSWPRAIGLITSPSGAAIRDVLQILARRSPWIEVVVYPVRVQGAEAAAEIAAALARANRDGRCELILLARGGGSLEDLWPFNEEVVARAIFQSRLPVVSAVGHETDVTIADLVADLRAPTPSAAAELVSPDGAALAGRLEHFRRLLTRGVLRHLERARQHLAHLNRRLRHPADLIAQRAQHLDHLEVRLRRALERALAERGHRLALLAGRLAAAHPERRLPLLRTRLAGLERRLHQAAEGLLAERRARLAHLAATLRAVSPLETLQRGYAIALDGRGRVVRSVAQVAVGDPLEVRLADGALGCRVTARRPAADNEDQKA
ncbi:MAG: exodeoxyribonuclease 7 large subunit [Porticoccaceae bacterium]|nr:MAG: exodeoxyribonuclease 7 large subunit [Porticoccaceae bacterium]